MTGDSKYPFNTRVDKYYNSCRIRDLISERGEEGNCLANAQVNCARQNKCSAILLRAKLSRKERNGWGEFVSVESSKYDPEF